MSYVVVVVVVVVVVIYLFIYLQLLLFSTDESFIEVEPLPLSSQAPPTTSVAPPPLSVAPATTSVAPYPPPVAPPLSAASRTSSLAQSLQRSLDVVVTSVSDPPLFRPTFHMEDNLELFDLTEDSPAGKKEGQEERRGQKEKSLELYDLTEEYLEEGLGSSPSPSLSEDESPLSPSQTTSRSPPITTTSQPSTSTVSPSPTTTITSEPEAPSARERSRFDGMSLVSTSNQIKRYQGGGGGGGL